MKTPLPDLTSINDSKEIIPRGKGSARSLNCCYCTHLVTRSLPVHLRKHHPGKWNIWCNHFLKLNQLGYTTREIMMLYSRLFTFKVIEKEMKRVSEERKLPLAMMRSRHSQGLQPNNFTRERTTVWRFNKRGAWAVHDGHYRGNWAPQVPRNLILAYTKRNDVVLDAFVGGATTLIECALLQRRGLGVDVSPHAVRISRQKLSALGRLIKREKPGLKIDVKVRLGDSRHLSFLDDESVDLICTQLPYGNALQYTATVPSDLSRISSQDEFFKQMEKVALEFKRVLKNHKRCAVMMGDVRKSGRLYPLGFRTLETFTSVGFALEDIVIKEQFNDSSVRFYSGAHAPRYLLAHEYLLIFRK
jgi:DNA modification methylase